MPLDRFIYALGIRHIGETTARDLAKALGTLEAFRAAAMAAAAGGKDSEAYRDLDNIEGIGETVVDALVDFFGEPHNVKALDDLSAEVTVEPFVRPQPTGLAVTDKTVVFTGTLEKMTRGEAKALAERLGRQGGGLGLEEDRLRRRRQRRRLQARQGARGRRHGAHRGRVAEARRQ